jgi:hypothetical protein
MQMKNLILFLFLFCFSCESKEENFAVTQIVNLQTRNQIGIKCPGKVITLELAYDNLNYDEIHALVREKTYSIWIAPKDTIWVLKDYKKLPDMYFVYSDSVLQSSYVKSYVPYYCK